MLTDLFKPKSEEEILQIIDDNGYSLDDLLLNSNIIGFTRGVHIALEKGADFHKWNDQALQASIINGHLEIFKILAKESKNIHMGVNYLLYLALQYKQIEIFNELEKY